MSAGVYRCPQGATAIVSQPVGKPFRRWSRAVGRVWLEPTTGGL